MYSKYFPQTSTCYEVDNTTSYADPNSIDSKKLTMTVSESPAAAADGGDVPGGMVGMAINGVPIFNDSAGPQTSIYTEEGSFDRCRGHPNSGDMYHYHEEPWSITQDDDALVGVMRDGFFIYGRRDPDGSIPGAADGGLSVPFYGHVGYTVDSPNTPVFHYHVHYETDGTNSGYFITPQKFYGTMGQCTARWPDGGALFPDGGSLSHC